MGGSNRNVIQLLTPQGIHLQEHKDLNVLGGGLPLLHKVTGGSSGAGKFFDSELPGRVFVWRPSKEGASFLGPRCTRRLVALPRALLKHFLLEQRVSVCDVPDSCFVGCKSWGDSARGMLVPGGVIVGLATESDSVTQPCGQPFFAALLSTNTLQLVI